MMIKSLVVLALVGMAHTHAAPTEVAVADAAAEQPSFELLSNAHAEEPSIVYDDGGVQLDEFQTVLAQLLQQLECFPVLDDVMSLLSPQDCFVTTLIDLIQPVEEPFTHSEVVIEEIVDDDVVDENNAEEVDSASPAATDM